jgi:hypothetical protein
MYVLVIIGLDPNNRLADAKGNPLGDNLISSTDGSHGCSHCDTGKVVKRTAKGFELVPTNSAELFVLLYDSEGDARKWLEAHQDALAGKLIYGYEPNYPRKSKPATSPTTAEEVVT